MEPLWHLALASAWQAAFDDGEYRVSTLGRTLEEEGFVHCSFRSQLDGVASRFYADVTEMLVALTIDPAVVGSEVRVEPAIAGDPSSERFPHVYGPIPITAVTDARPCEISDGAVRFLDGAV